MSKRFEKFNHSQALVSSSVYSCGKGFATYPRSRWYYDAQWRSKPRVRRQGSVVLTWTSMVEPPHSCANPGEPMVQGMSQRRARKKVQPTDQFNPPSQASLTEAWVN
ncbi:hypothetical protein F4781DRAFT_430678 [Annulohypoxylon bovei var. microspora]|nr:hypothetical protein F4781DRAFT_430678 [Annulohypoxylon bovei var. microspora]